MNSSRVQLVMCWWRLGVGMWSSQSLLSVYKGNSFTFSIFILKTFVWWKKLWLATAFYSTKVLHKFAHDSFIVNKTLHYFFFFYSWLAHSLARGPLCREQSSKGKSMESDRDKRQGKENVFGAMCCRSKTWQSHDQRHLIILELHCSFNPSERTIFYWGGREDTMPE